MARGHFVPLQPHSSSLLLCTLFLCCGLHHCCYTCLLDSKDQQSLCDYLRKVERLVMKEECEDTFIRAFSGMEIIPIELKGTLKDHIKKYQQEVKKIPLQDYNSWQIEFQAMTVERVREAMAMVKNHKFPECIPPCGLQKHARTYNCRYCSEEDCDLPVACDLVDISVKENSKTTMSCNVTFPLPETFTVSWKFAKNLRATDLSYFKIQHRLENDLLYIIKTTLIEHKGTYFCEIQDSDDDILVEKFFFVDVSRKERTKSLYLRKLFNQILAGLGINQNVWGSGNHQVEDGENFGFDFIGFIYEEKPLGIPALVFATVASFLFFFLVTMLITMSIFTIIDEG